MHECLLCERDMKKSKVSFILQKLGVIKEYKVIAKLTIKIKK